jgi:uncharacterized protein (DUF4415 family)
MKHDDFSKAKRNPYARHLKRQVTIRLEHDTIAYFKAPANETGIPYQTLINLYLRECASSRNSGCPCRGVRRLDKARPRDR